MKRMKRLLPLAATAAIASLALAACGGGSGDDAASDGPLETLSIQAPFLSTSAPKADNDVEQALEKQIGTKLDMAWVHDASYEDKTNITLAGDDVPDVMVIKSKSPGFVKNAEAGAFWDLTDKLDAYPNLKTTFPAVQQAASINGKVYGIFRLRDTMRESVIVRADWLKKLGLEMPKTTDDLLKVAQAFTEQDPDGNGKNDTYGVVIPKWPGGMGSGSPFDAIETWFGAGNRYAERDGKIVANFDTDEWLAAVDYEKQLIDGGYVNGDFATFDSTKWNEPFLNGKAGIIIDTYSRAGQLTNLMKDVDPKGWEHDVDFTGNLIGPDGTLHALPTEGYAGFLAIPKAKVKTEAQLDQVLSALNELNSKEAGILINNGLEGVHYEVKDGYAVGLPDVPEDVMTQAKSFAQIGMNVTGFQRLESKQATEVEQANYERRQKIMDSDYQQASFDPASGLVSDTYVAKGAQLDIIVSDARLKYLAGQISREQLTSEIARWHSSGGDDILAELNELASAAK